MAVFYSMEGLFAVVFLITIILEIYFFCCSQKSKNVNKVISHHQPTTKFAVLIPARDESAVIEETLKSVVSNHYPKELFHIYVIVESLKDPSVEIVKQYPNASIFVRQDLTKHTKGNALDECVKQIIADEQNYDGYLILDADNLIQANFLQRMNDVYCEGYDMAVGKRDNKYWNSSVVSASSSLTFNIINEFVNKVKFKQNKTILVTGTGFFIKADIINQENGWIFHSLTEDYEITSYAFCNRLKTAYVEDAIFLDEQPDSLHVSIVQRSRWVKGFFFVLKKYTPLKNKVRKSEKLSLFETIRAKIHLVFIFDIIFYFLTVLLFLIYALIVRQHIAGLFIRFGVILGLVYLFIAGLSIRIFVIEKNNLNISKKNKVKAVLFNPIFLFCYIFAAIRAIFIGNTWEKIEHKRKKRV